MIKGTTEESRKQNKITHENEARMKRETDKKDEKKQWNGKRLQRNGHDRKKKWNDNGKKAGERNRTKALADRGGWRKEIPPLTWIRAFSPLFLCPLKGRRTQLWGTLFTVLRNTPLVGNLLLPTPFRNRLRKRVKEREQKQEKRKRHPFRRPLSQNPDQWKTCVRLGPCPYKVRGDAFLYGHWSRCR